MKMTAIILDACQNLKGGELISRVYEYLLHGDPHVKQFVHKLIEAVCFFFFYKKKLF